MADIEQQARELLAAEYERYGDPIGAARARTQMPSTGVTLRAIAAALHAAPNWQPINTAPLDGSRLMLWDGDKGCPVFGRGSPGGDDSPITHWAPESGAPIGTTRPAPPAQGIRLAQPAPIVTRYRIEDAPGLDPVTVYVENYEPGKGRMVVTCYGSAWTAFWGAMGVGTTLEQFVASCSPEYVADGMVWGTDAKKPAKHYADKVAAAVVAFFKGQRDAAPGVGNG